MSGIKTRLGAQEILSIEKFLLNAWAFIQNSTFAIEGDGCLLETTLLGNVQEFKYKN